MNRSFLMGFSLTLLALMCVLLAGIFFLSQNRIQLQNELATLKTSQNALEADLLQQNVNIDDIEATKTAVEATVTEINTAVSQPEAENVALDSQLVASQQQVDTLAADLATRTVERDEANASVSALELSWQQLLDQSPTVDILAPTNGTTVAPRTLVDITIAASHPLSLTAVTLFVDDEMIATYNDEIEAPFFTAQTGWRPTQPGTYVISVVANNGLDNVSLPISTTVTVAQPTPTPQAQ